MEKETEKDAESAEVKLPYPKAVLFIITTEFCERFSYYGMKGDLSWDLGPRILAKFHCKIRYKRSPITEGGGGSRAQRKGLQIGPSCPGFPT